MERATNTAPSVLIAGRARARGYSINHNVNLTRRKLWTFRLTAVAAGFVLALTFAEIALRVAGWPAPGFYVQGSGPIELRTPGKIGGAFPPGFHGELRHYDYSVECNVNRYGFRDREVTPKQPDEWRIGILGDSFTAGVGVEERERFASLFAAKVHEQRPNVTVWNLGAPNCGTGCEADMLDAVKRDYNFDEIVLAFYSGNDLQDNQSWVNTQSASANNNSPRFTSERAWLREHSRLATFLWVNSIRAWTRFEPEGIYSTEHLNRYWPATEKSFERLLQTVSAQSLTVLYLPARPEWDDQAWQDTRKHSKTPDADRFLTRDAVSQWTKDHGITFVDATPWLRACQPAVQCLFSTDPHWTNAGHRLVANGLIEYWSKRN